MIQAVQADETDMAIASFRSARSVGLGLTKSLGYWGIRLFTGRKCSPAFGTTGYEASLVGEDKFSS